MYDIKQEQFVPVPQDRPLSEYEDKLVKFATGERIFLKGMAFLVQDIGQQSITLIPVLRKHS